MPSLWGTQAWDPKGKHCYVTGGSAGLGLDLAILLASRGAHVSIVARNIPRLEKSMVDIEAARQSPDQIFRWHAFSLSSAQGSKDALEAVSAPHGGKSPDAVFLCAGKSTPRFFVEMSDSDLTDGMANGYWVEAWTAWAAARQMVRQSRKGKIVFVSSVLGYMSLIGYTSYSPAKHALRGLADALRFELLLYSIDVHIFFPCTIYSPGYEEENKTKPKITLQIEEGDSGLTPKQAAAALLKGVEKNHIHITPDLISNLFRVNTRGSAPGHNVFFDMVLTLIAWIGIPVWCASVVSKVTAHREEHKAYLTDRNFYLSPEGQTAAASQDGKNDSAS